MRRPPFDTPDRAADALGRRDLLKLLAGAGAARAPLPDAATRRRMAALVEGA
jgi:hypothetical protein